MISKTSKKRERKNGMKRLMRSNMLREGKHNGMILTAKWITTRSGKDAIRLIFEDKMGRTVSVIVVPGNIHGDRIIDNILNIYGEDDADLEDIEGMKLAFEIEANGDFYNLKNVYELDEDNEEDDGEILEEDDDLLEEDEDDLLDQFEEGDDEEDDDDYDLED